VSQTLERGQQVQQATSSKRHLQECTSEYISVRITNYEQFLHEINIKDLVFPLSLKQIPKFASLNPTIHITVLAYDDDEKDFIPLYVSPHHNRQHQVNLLLLKDGDKHHYTLIRNMSRLVAGRTKHGKNNYVCEYCLHPCS
jgi:hypothetical protein